MKLISTKFFAIYFGICLAFVTIINSITYSQYRINSYNLTSYSMSDMRRSIINRIEGGFVIAGFSNSRPNITYSDRNYDWMFMKLQQNGLSIDCIKLYGFDEADSCYSVVELSKDSNFVMAGFMTKTSDHKPKASFLKLNKNCGRVISKRINDTLRHQYRQVVTCPGDSIVFTGWSEHKVGGTVVNKIIVSRYTYDGTGLWINKYVHPNTPTSIYEEAYSVCYQPWDNTYAVAATYYSDPESRKGILLLKLGRNGNIMRKKTFIYNIGSYITEPRKIIPIPDGGFVIVGFSNVFDDAAMDIIVLRVNSDLNLVYFDFYGIEDIFEYGKSIVLAPDGNLVLTGFRITSNPLPNKDIIIVKVPLEGGNPLWRKKVADITMSDMGYDIINIPNSVPNGFGLTGNFYSPPGGFSFDPFLIKTDTGGIIPGTTCIEDFALLNFSPEPAMGDPSLGMTALTDIGWSPYPGSRSPGAFITTLCSSAASPIKNIKKYTQLEYSLKQNYPNPFNPLTKIKFDLPKVSDVQLTVYDILGKDVAVLINEKLSTGTYEVDWDGTYYPSGVYFYKLMTDDFVDVKKMVLVK